MEVLHEQGTSGNQLGQLGALEKLGRGKGKMQAAQQTSHAPDVGPLILRSYLEERAKRLLYNDPDLHVLVRFLSPCGSAAGACWVCLPFL